VLIRDERLKAELERMQVLRSQSEFIDFVVAGTPPDRYTVFFTCKGLMMKDDHLVTTSDHRVLVYLHSEYPRRQPRITWITPVFHPNVRGREVCLGRSWSPAMMLDDLCLELGAIVQYKTFNLDDPLNSEAARVIRELLATHPKEFPVDPRNLLGPPVDLQLEAM
jgi:ubiquitin-protein ligase